MGVTHKPIWFRCPCTTGNSGYETRASIVTLIRPSMRLCNKKLVLWPWTYTPGLCTCLQTISVMRALAGCRSRLSWQLSRSSQSISSQPVCVCWGCKNSRGGARRGTENPQGILRGGAEYTRVYCTGVPQSGEAKFPVTPADNWQLTLSFDTARETASI